MTTLKYLELKLDFVVVSNLNIWDVRDEILNSTPPNYFKNLLYL